MITIRNLTSETLPLVIQEISGDHEEYDLYLSPKGKTDIDWHFKVLGLEKLVAAGLVECNMPLPTPVTLEEMITSDAPTEEKTDEVRETEEGDEEGAPVSNDKIICDLCGAEFASTRGLASHKSRAHAE